MEEKIKEITDIINWYSENGDKLEPLDALKCMEATMVFADKLKPMYEKYNKAENKGFKILARVGF